MNVAIILITLGSLLLLAVALLALLYVAAKTNRWATFVETGGMKFIVRGGTLYKVLANIPGFVYDKDKEVLCDLNEIKDKEKKKEIEKKQRGGWLASWLQDRFGIFWVSFFYPLIKVHDFNIVADKLKEEIEGQRQLPLRERIQSEIRNAKGYLRHRFAHPIIIPGVELGKDRWKVDLILVVDIRVVNPTIVVFDYKGTVMRQVDAAIASAAIDYWNNIPVLGSDGNPVKNEDGTTRMVEFGYPEFVATDKGPTSDFAKRIKRLNKVTSPSPIEDGLVTRFGLEIMAAWIEMVDLSPEQQALDDAARENERQKLLADARIQEARGEQVFQRDTRIGVAEGFEDMVRRLITLGTKPSDAINLAMAHAKTANLAAAPNLQSYVEGGSQVVPTLPIGGKQ